MIGNTAFPRHKRDHASPLIFVLSIAMPFFCTSCQAENRPVSTPVAVSPTLVGTWQVTEVQIDQGDSHRKQTTDHEYNVHQFLGRVFSFTPQLITTNAPEEKRCENPKIISTRITALELVSKSLASRGFSPNRPGPKDFQLPLADNESVEALSVLCKDELWNKNLGGGLGKNVGLKGAWIVVLKNEQLALRWDDEAILILRRLPQDAKPVASFDCKKASIEAEKSICQSVALASLDESVAQTYKFALAYFKTQKASAKLDGLRKSQKEWLAQRNACAADTACLEKTMETRIEDLEYEVAEYGYERRTSGR